MTEQAIAEQEQDSIPADGKSVLNGRLGMTATHKFLGVVKITDDCLAMQSMNPDPTSMYVEHDGDIKEVSRNMVHVELHP